MPLRAILPATAIIGESKGTRRCSTAVSARSPNGDQALGLSSRPKKVKHGSCILPPLHAAPEPIGNVTTLGSVIHLLTSRSTAIRESASCDVVSSFLSSEYCRTSAISSESLTGSLESVEVLDLTGKAIRITDLWRDRKAVIAFARHFG
ncbi:hypothetical protein GW17_00003884 [Ensete ventricosum]|nr:hypothetical protein GW17_00003884 [Ensete ventricosum]